VDGEDLEVVDGRLGGDVVEVAVGALVGAVAQRDVRVGELLRVHPLHLGEVADQTDHRHRRRRARFLGELSR
jgi:hypothetical protein